MERGWRQMVFVTPGRNLAARYSVQGTMKIQFLLLVAAVLAPAQDKPRVFVSESNSWETQGSGGGGIVGGTGGWGGSSSGGARPQTVEIMKTFNERCPEVRLTTDRAKADFVVMLEKEGGKGTVRRDNKVAVINKDGDVLYTGSTRSLGNAVKDACSAMLGNRKTN